MSENYHKLCDFYVIFTGNVCSIYVALLLQTYQKSAKHKGYPYSEDFTNDMMFEKMSQGCVYCGNTATTLDRINSSICHTIDNCVGCCSPCNYSKGNSDPNTFLRKAFYRSRGEYYDNISDIWSDNVSKPNYNRTKSVSQKRKRDFTLTREEWDMIVVGDCSYCKRIRPDDKWNGVDRVNSDIGYTIENTVSCCNDCNVDKMAYSIDETRIRNNNIADRLKNEDIVLFECETALRNTGTNAKNVCAYGKVYSSYVIASQMLGKSFAYVAMTLRNKRYPDDIFVISNEFYEKYKDSNEYITKKMLDEF